MSVVRVLSRATVLPGRGHIDATFPHTLGLGSGSGLPLAGEGT